MWAGESSSLVGDAVERAVIPIEQSCEAERKGVVLSWALISAGSWSMLMTGSLGASGRSPELARTSAIREQKAREQTSGVLVLHFGHLKDVVRQPLLNGLLICYKVILLST